MAQIYIQDAVNGVEEIIFIDNLFKISSQASACTLTFVDSGHTTGTVVINSTNNGVEIAVRVKEAIKKVDGGGGATVDMSGLYTTGSGIVVTE
tara:strand:- start:6200 stop:6478 length:279 start_codon:yes stop_codon:yes gene_type:complete